MTQNTLGMTVGELKQMLETANDSALVVFRSFPSKGQPVFWPLLTSITGGLLYMAEDPWEGYVEDKNATAEQIGIHPEDWESQKRHNAECMVLIPMGQSKEMYFDFDLAKKLSESTREDLLEGRRFLS